MSCGRVIVRRWLAMLLGLGTVGGCVAPRVTRLRLPDAAPTAIRHAGVYGTAKDYEAGRLVDSVACGSRSPAPDRYTVRRAPIVAIAHGDQRTQYVKSQVYGFRACDGVDVRFVVGDDWNIVRAPPIYLYQRDRTVFAGKSPRVVTDHGFGISSADSVRALTADATANATTLP